MGTETPTMVPQPLTTRVRSMDGDSLVNYRALATVQHADKWEDNQTIDIHVPQQTQIDSMVSMDLWSH